MPNLQWMFHRSVDSQAEKRPVNSAAIHPERKRKGVPPKRHALN
jgi:hypothetical protein